MNLLYSQWGEGGVEGLCAQVSENYELDPHANLEIKQLVRKLP